MSLQQIQCGLTKRQMRKSIEQNKVQKYTRISTLLFDKGLEATEWEGGWITDYRNF